MELKPGDKLGAYEIVSAIGKGGMGEVWRAHDPQLGRDVAIKVSAQQFTDRFEREARAIAALNHPNVCTLYHIGPNYLVMEYIEGSTLAERIKEGPIPLEEALGIAKQIAAALEAAHEKNIVHRDLKPGNVKIRPDGSVKVLDFGLAKTGVTQEVTPDSPTMMPGTQMGMILGTAGYMSPEQARGKEVDKRADIWAFGVVLYEMVTGKRLFEGETVSDTLAAVLTREPDWERTPARARKLLKACLEKDPKRRLRDIGDMGRLLEGEDATAAPVQSRFGKTPWVAAVAALAALLAAVSFVHFREKPPVGELTRFQIPTPPGENFPAVPMLEVSPDGRKLAFVTTDAGAKLHLWVRSFDSLDSRVLPGIEVASWAAPLFWSPDSHFIAFVSADHKLKKVDASGGPAQTLCDVAGVVGGSWSKDGVILFSDGAQRVMRVFEGGGTPTALTAPPARQARADIFPKLLPDGSHFLYFHGSDTPETTGVYVGTIDAKPSQQSSKPLLVNQDGTAYYVPSGNSGIGRSDHGYLLFDREGTVLAQPLNPDKLELSGDPVPIAEQVSSFSPGGMSMSFFSASANGVLVFVTGYSGDLKAQLTWFDREGKNLGAVGQPGVFSGLALSRDGKQAVVTIRAGSESRLQANLWLLDLTRGGAATRFTFDASTDTSPVFSPDGSSIVFASMRDRGSSLYRKLTSGIKDEDFLLKTEGAGLMTPSGWSPDGRFLLYTDQTLKSKSDIWILPMEGSRKSPVLFQGTDFNETSAQFSPDGHWIAYNSDESGRDEVYVREFSLGADGKPEATAKHQISNGGAGAPHWRGDGKELLYGSQDRRTVMSSEIIATKPVFRVLPARALFQLPAVPGASATVSADGKRFLIAMPVSQSGPQQFTVVLNWQAGVKK